MGHHESAGEAIVPSGMFLMGSDKFYPEEAPVHSVSVDEFRMDTHLVTNLDYEAFVSSTGYVTTAERQPNPDDYPGIDPKLIVPGSLVFERPRRKAPATDYRTWWRYTQGACWRFPEGPGSTVRGRENHPVVHVSYEDAEAYAKWVCKELPTSAMIDRDALCVGRFHIHLSIPRTRILDRRNDRPRMNSLHYRPCRLRNKPPPDLLPVLFFNAERSTTVMWSAGKAS